MTTRRFFRLEVLTDLSASRLAPSGLRPNALPLHNVRDPKTKRTAEDRHPRRGHSAFFTPSAFALDKLIDRTGKDRSAITRSTSDETLGPKALVEPDGIEPTTSCLQSTRSPN